MIAINSWLLYQAVKVAGIIIFGTGHIIVILAGISIVVMAVLVVYLLVRFVTTKSENTVADYIEITESQQPKLFKIINDLSKAAFTRKPGKVYISPDVNAMVQLNLGFWNLLWPVKKKLILGLGLMKYLTVDELRAVVAHEFGHFSQKTMKIGAYVYYCNTIIYQMVNGNSKFEQMIISYVKEGNSVLVIVPWLGLRYLDLMKWILSLFYKLLNISYLSLSREMEYHADAVAAEIVGAQPLKDSLLSFTLLEVAYQNVLTFYNEHMNLKYATDNLYDNYESEVFRISRYNKLNMNGKIPIITQSVVDKLIKSKITFKDQWASHPTTTERFAKLDEMDGLQERKLNTELSENLIIEIQNIEKEITKKIFSHLEYYSEAVMIDNAEFNQVVEKDNIKLAINSYYNGYYDRYSPQRIEFSELGQYPAFDREGIQNLFNETTVTEVNNFAVLEDDLQFIQSAMDGSINLKMLDYDGTKYYKKDFGELFSELTNQRSLLKDRIKENDAIVFYTFLNISNSTQKEELQGLYEKFWDFADSLKDYTKFIDNLVKELSFLSKELQYYQIIHELESLRPHEQQLKAAIKEDIQYLLEFDYLNVDFTKENLEYCEEKTEYFDRIKYNDLSLQKLMNAVNAAIWLRNLKCFFAKKKILDYQITLIEH